MNTREELKIHGLNKVNAIIARTMLETVTIKDSICDLWIECVNDTGDVIRLIPDTIGRQDGYKEIMAMNCRTGKNVKLLFTDNVSANTVFEDKIVVSRIPWQVLNWAISKAK